MRSVRVIGGVLVLAAWLAGAAVPAAQNTARIDGEVRDRDGKPWAGIIVLIKSDDTGMTNRVVTDKNGLYTQGGLRSGIYTLSFKFKDPADPKAEEKLFYETKTRLTTGAEERVNVNVKDLFAKQQGEQAETRKKQEDEKKKFDTLKLHFEQGKASLDQALQTRNEIPRAAAEQKEALKQKAEQLTQTAINEFTQAQKVAPADDPNLSLVNFYLGESYAAAGQFEQAVSFYEKAIALKPTEAGYFNNLGNALARTGKIPEAGAAYEKAATIEPGNAAMFYRNFGIVLFNSGKMKEALEPLRKSTQLDPNNAQTWYVLGASLVGTMEYKQEGDKISYILQPGTIEAYQKCIELDPNGPYGMQAKQGLEQLQALGLGVSTKVKSQPTKKRP